MPLGEGVVALSTNDANTKTPPPTRRRVNDSPSIRTDARTVTTGSTVDTMAAVDGPIFSIPVKNDQNASTVETNAMDSTAPMLEASWGKEKPETPFITPYTRAAPSMMYAEDEISLPFLTTRALTKIYPV